MISIHTTTQVVTLRILSQEDMSTISIHTTTQVVTSRANGPAYDDYIFQSTPPRRW